MSEYVEFYGDHVFLVQMIPNIAQISIFINFIKNRIFMIFIKIRKKKTPRSRPKLKKVCRPPPMGVAQEAQGGGGGGG